MSGGIMWQKVKDNLQAIQNYFPIRCIERHLLQKSLKTLTGDLFQHADVICDIRPVFDSSYASI